MSARRVFAAASFVVILSGLLAAPGLAQDAQRRKGFSIAITEPPENDIVLGKTKLAATVEIDRPAVIERVEFFVNEVLVFVDREPPYETFYDFGEESKSWVVRAVAHHREGITVSDSAVTRKVVFGEVQEVNRVILWATVTDKRDQFVEGLDKSDFRVSENGVPQEVLDFYPEDRPITLAILLDTSGSMREQIKDVHEAAGSFVDTLRPEDRAMVIDFNDNVFLIQDLTSDHAALKEAITSTEALGATALYDALHAAYRKLRKVEGRKAIVLLSDGEDTLSELGFDRVLEEAKSQSILIYGIGLGGGLGEGAKKNVLRNFADTTGGRPYFVDKASELGGVYRRIADELRRQYYLTYSTTNKDWNGRWMEIRVETDDADHKVRARRGYFAVKSAIGAGAGAAAAAGGAAGP